MSTEITPLCYDDATYIFNKYALSGIPLNWAACCECGREKFDPEEQLTLFSELQILFA